MRHWGAYAELAALEFARARRDIAAQLIAWCIVAIGLFFGLALACFGIIAYTWNTDYRVASIAWMSGAFILIAVCGALYGFGLMRRRRPFFSTIQQQWQQDKVIIERILSDDEGAP